MDINDLPVDCLTCVISAMDVYTKIVFAMTKYDYYILTKKIFNVEFPEILYGHRLTIKMQFYNIAK